MAIREYAFKQARNQKEITIMAKKAASLLTGSVIAAKGAAAPSSDVKTQDEGDRIAVTVRLLPADYRRLKLFGLENRISNQNIIVDALNAYLRKDANE